MQTNSIIDIITAQLAVLKAGGGCPCPRCAAKKAEFISEGEALLADYIAASQEQEPEAPAEQEAEVNTVKVDLVSTIYFNQRDDFSKLEIGIAQGDVILRADEDDQTVIRLSPEEANAYAQALILAASRA